MLKRSHNYWYFDYVISETLLYHANNEMTYKHVKECIKHHDQYKINRPTKIKLIQEFLLIKLKAIL